MKIISLFLAIIFSTLSFSQKITTRFEESGGKQSPAYFEIIEWWKKIDQVSNQVKMLTMGQTDAGYPLNLVIVSNNGESNFTRIHQQDKRVILINNGIHPGEPDGIDASMLLVRDIVTHKISLPSNVVLAIIPVYNIGGCLNRSKNYRIDQTGPEEKGFRGNSQNLDLNRDFIKCDSKEARSFIEIFHLVKPDVMVDNHVSDGADYQHVMTLVSSQFNKLGPVMGEFMHTEFEPGLRSLMKSKGYDLIPYVNEFDMGETPESGWPAFMDSPRYSSGFGTLWHCFSFMPETHMLKPYDQRVRSAYALMQCFIEFTSRQSAMIKKAIAVEKETAKTQLKFPLSWELDKTRADTIHFKGYVGAHKPSEVSGLSRLYYDRNQPFEKKIPYYNYYTPGNYINQPKAYIIPKGWWKVVELLKLNKVSMMPLARDSAIEVEVYQIEDYKSSSRPYEMHHPNGKVKTSSSVETIKFSKGDYYIPLNQDANRFLVEVLEPISGDSYFAWNFFDAILGQKEYFSDYSFEDIAAEYLKAKPELKKKLEEKRASDTAFAKSAEAQLNFVYMNSPYIEPAFGRYPVYRVAPYL